MRESNLPAGWGVRGDTERTAQKILLEHPDAAFGWGQSLKSILDGDPKMLGSRWFGVEGALAGLAVPLVRETLKPAGPAEELVPAKFIRDRGTLYLIGTKSGGGAMAPFLIAMMDEITETAREMAIRLPGNRLDPPLSLVLDEIANMSSSWPGLVTLMSDGGGLGISPLVVLQSLAQARGGWGAEEAQAVIEGEGRGAPGSGANRASGDELAPPRRDSTWSASQGDVPVDDDGDDTAVPATEPATLEGSHP